MRKNVSLILAICGTLLLLLILGFGWAKPVPVSTRNFKSPRKDELHS